MPVLQPNVEGALSPVTARRRRWFRSGGLDTSEGSAFVQERLATFGKFVFLVSFGFFSIDLALYASEMMLRTLLANPRWYSHLGASMAAATLWMACRWGKRPTWALNLLDTAGLLLCCLFWAFMGISSADAPPIMAALMADILTVTARAMMVPSTGGRTLVLSTAAMVPTLVIGYLRSAAVALSAMDRLHFNVENALWAAAAVALATVTSRLIYGLRKRAQEAREIGQYTLVERLGAGGMGEVWRARHRLLVRPAAIKLLPPDPLGSSAGGRDVLLRRFEREASATALLQSPHTVQLYDFGLAEDGRLYYVMELLNGIDLEQLVQRYGPVPSERVIHILKQVCHSLAEAHTNGLVHRDIKPANIFISRIASELDFVKVLDFGLVKLDRYGDQPDQLRLTRADSASGTPGYMAPEIVLGETEYDHRVDLYALGCVAYWLLTGRMVFERDTPMKVMLDHARSPAPRLSTRTELSIPRALEDIVMSCLEKDPAQRPTSAEKLEAQLAACPVPSPWTAERAARWWQVHLPEQRPHGLADQLRAQEQGLALKPAHRHTLVG